MGEPTGGSGVDASGLRERLSSKPDAPVQALSVETAQDAVEQLNREEANENKDEKEKKTYGRTSDGTGECRLNLCHKDGFQVERSTTSICHWFIVRLLNEC